MVCQSRQIQQSPGWKRCRWIMIVANKPCSRPTHARRWSAWASSGPRPAKCAFILSCKNAGHSYEISVVGPLTLQWLLHGENDHTEFRKELRLLNITQSYYYYITVFSTNIVKQRKRHVIWRKYNCLGYFFREMSKMSCGTSRPQCFQVYNFEHALAQKSFS